MGSRLSIQDRAYIAGFLDGDGSLMFQIKRVSDRTSGYRIMMTICFYQDTRHEKPLYWIQRKLRIGYVTRRNDGMTELRINGYRQTKKILELLLPFVQFKRAQARAVIRAAGILMRQTLKKLSVAKKMQLLRCFFLVQDHNYRSHNRKKKYDLMKMLNLTP